jgi:hypothetical protein
MEKDNNLDAFNTIVNALQALDSEKQKRTIQAVLTFLGIQFPEIPTQHIHKRESDYNKPLTSSKEGISFSEDRTMSSKDFLKDKSPKTDIERIACLAYYLTNYKGIPYFKTIDLSTLNTEAAQPKFSNAALAVNNATTAGLLVPAGKGNKQITAAGEEFVRLLPDRDAAKEGLANARIKKRNRKSAARATKTAKSRQ